MTAVPPVSDGWDFPADLPEAAWGLIANAWEGDWSKAPAEWREAAERWRDAWHKTLAVPPVSGSPTAGDVLKAAHERWQLARDKGEWPALNTMELAALLAHGSDEGVAILPDGTLWALEKASEVEVWGTAEGWPDAPGRVRTYRLRPSDTGAEHGQ